MLQAAGTSYTRENYFSALTGLPTVVGWEIHEWLWRGDYQQVRRRQQQVALIYQGERQEARRLLKKYRVRYILVGRFERQKYPRLDEDRWREWGKLVFEKGSLRIYRLNLAN